MKFVNKLFAFFLIISSIVVFSTSGTYAATSMGTQSSEFSIRYIDVGQGDAALIQCDSHYMLIDGGPSEKSSKIYSILKDEGITKLDYIIATHPDADHIGGLSGALNYASTEVCYCTVNSHDTKTFRNLTKYLKKQNISITIPKTNTEIALGKAKVSFLDPGDGALLDPGDGAQGNTSLTQGTVLGAEDLNESIIVRIDYGQNSFLFMADAETEEENRLLKNCKNLDCDILKVAHHGSSSSSSPQFLKAVSPKYAIISVGKENSYGHPTQDTLDNLSATGAIVLRTDLHGDIIVTSDGKEINVLTEKSPNPAAVLGTLSVVPVPETTYVLNSNTKKFHYPTCNSVYDIKAKNRQDVTLTREEIIEMGYVPCKRCHP